MGGDEGGVSWQPVRPSHPGGEEGSGWRRVRSVTRLVPPAVEGGLWRREGGRKMVSTVLCAVVTNLGCVGCP